MSGAGPLTRRGTCAAKLDGRRTVNTLTEQDSLDFIIAINEGHVRAILREWVTHYNRGRPHASLGPGVPEGSVVAAVVSQSNGRLVPAGCRVAATRS